MLDQGVDAYCGIPYLMTFMGHRTIKCTEQYLWLTPVAHDGIIGALTPLYGDLFPGGCAK